MAQSNFSAQDFKEKVQEYTKVPYFTMLQTLPLGTWVRYRIKKRGEEPKYRLGGALMYVDPEMRYIKLKNFQVDSRVSPATWSVQLNSYTTMYYKLTPNGEKKILEASKASGVGVSDKEVKEFLEKLASKSLYKVTKLQ